jgi:hypothetical protein
MGLADRLRRLEGSLGTATPWFSLSPGEEPDWPRPLAHLSLEALEVLNVRDIVRYCEANAEGWEHRPSAEDTYEYSEAFHELRWRRWGIARRSFTGRQPEGWTPPAEEDVQRYTDTVEGRKVLELLQEETNLERMNND